MKQLTNTPTRPPYREHAVARGPHRLRVREYEGEGSALVLMHGFPDNLHLHDRLVGHLGGRHVAVFDFLGWGGSDKPERYPYTFDSLTRDLAAVVDGLGLERIVPVAHDASGPPAIDWALAHPKRTAGLVLLNTFYGASPTLRSPEAIALFSSPWTRRLARAASGHLDLFARLYRWQVGRRFIRDETVRREVVPRLYAQFAEGRGTRDAFFRLNEDYRPTLAARARRWDDLARLAMPVRIVFGADDYTLGAGVAGDLHARIPGSELFLLAGARHFPQLDEPEAVARLLLEAPTAPDGT